jgi:uncharacterized membrane protein
VNVFLWVLQGVLAAVFAGSGVMKMSQRKEALAPRLPWVADFSAGTVRFIGAVEVLGAVGLILPAATGVVPVLTPIAAVGLGVTMVLAAVTHVRRKELSGVVVNVVLLALLVIVALGRFR